jgi:predicted dehydrogenase
MATLDKVRVGIIGLGRISSLNMLGYIRHPDAEIVAVCDKSVHNSRTRLKQMEADEGWQFHGEIYKDYHDLLKNEDLNTVEVLTPHSTHEQIVIDACEAGKNVSVQKPFSTTIASCDRMIDAAKSAGVHLRVCENFRWHEPYMRAKEMVDRGDIGNDVVSLRERMYTSFQARGGWDVDPTAWVWRSDPNENPGGCLQFFDDGQHKISIMRWFLGEIESVYAYLQWGSIPGGNLYYDLQGVIIFQPTNQFGHGIYEVTFSKDLPIPSNYYPCDEVMEITGTTGVIFCNGCTGHIFPELPPLALYTTNGFQTYADMRTDWQYSFENCGKHFIDFLTGKARDQMSLTPEEGREQVRLALAVVKSFQEKRVVAVSEIEE